MNLSVCVLLAGIILMVARVVTMFRNVDDRAYVDGFCMIIIGLIAFGGALLEIFL